MDRWILAAACAIALTVAAQCAVRWGGLTRNEDDASDDVGTLVSNALATLRAATVTLYAAAIGGVLVAGFGGRLFMRILGATSPDSLHGVLTDADEEIGKISFGGSLFLILFMGLFSGFIVSLTYRVARRWLPAKAWQAGIVSSLLAFGVFGAGINLLATRNKDFRVLSPVWLAVTLILATAALLGATTGAVHDRLDRGMPTLAKERRAVLAYAPLLLFAVTVPVLPALAAIVLVGSMFAPLFRRAGHAQGLITWGRRAVPVAAAISAFVVASNAIGVLTLN